MPATETWHQILFSAGKWEASAITDPLTFDVWLDRVRRDDNLWWAKPVVDLGWLVETYSRQGDQKVIYVRS